MVRLSLESSKKFWLGIENLVRGYGIKGKYEINVYSVSEKEMGLLGKKWMGDDRLHEVISWPLDPPSLKASEGQEKFVEYPDGIVRLGEIAILEGQEDRLDFLVEHGVKHLLGAHHD